MPSLDLRKTYEDGQTPSELDIDGLSLPLETFLNLTKIDSDNIQTSAVTTALLAAGAVTEDKIAAGNVTRAKLASFNYTLSSSCGSFTSSSASLVDVTNLSASITTSGRPVRIVLVSANNSGAWSIFGGAVAGASATFYAYILRGSTEIGIQALTVGATGGTLAGASVPCSAVSHIDVVGAGTYTYKVQISIVGTGLVAITEAKLLVYEIV